VQDTIAQVITEIDRNGMLTEIQNHDGANVVLRISNCKMSFG